MPKKQPTLRQQIEAFKKDKSFLDDGFFYFYDWFCGETSLRRKAESLMPKVIKFVKAKGIDLDTHYVFFKNNCPFNGPLYDDFRICDKDGVVYTVTPKSGHNGKAEVWGRGNDFNKALHVEENWSGLISELEMLRVARNWVTSLQNR